MSDEIVMKVGGHHLGNLLVDALVSRCGSVVDGISVAFTAKGECGWVIDFKDFERVYLAAKKFREDHAEQLKQELERFEHMMGGQP